jgi:hypothetical protein
VKEDVEKSECIYKNSAYGREEWIGEGFVIR